MKRSIKPLLCALLLSFSCANFVYASDVPMIPNVFEETDAQINALEETDNTNMVDEDIKVPSSQISAPIVDVSNKITSPLAAPPLIQPTVEAPKRLLKPANRRVNLQAIILIPQQLLSLLPMPMK